MTTIFLFIFMVLVGVKEVGIYAVTPQVIGAVAFLVAVGLVFDHYR